MVVLILDLADTSRRRLGAEKDAWGITGRITTTGYPMPLAASFRPRVVMRPPAREREEVKADGPAAMVRLPRIFATDLGNDRLGQPLYTLARSNGCSVLGSRSPGQHEEGAGVMIAKSGSNSLPISPPFYHNTNC